MASHFLEIFTRCDRKLVRRVSVTGCVAVVFHQDQHAKTDRQMKLRGKGEGCSRTDMITDKCPLRVQEESAFLLTRE